MRSVLGGQSRYIAEKPISRDAQDGQTPEEVASPAHLDAPHSSPSYFRHDKWNREFFQDFMFKVWEKHGMVVVQDCCICADLCCSCFQARKKMYATCHEVPIISYQILSVTLSNDIKWNVFLANMVIQSLVGRLLPRFGSSESKWVMKHIETESVSNMKRDNHRIQRVFSTASCRCGGSCPSLRQWAPHLVVTSIQITLSHPRTGQTSQFDCYRSRLDVCMYWACIKETFAYCFVLSCNHTLYHHRCLSRESPWSSWSVPGLRINWSLK